MASVLLFILTNLVAASLTIRVYNGTTSENLLGAKERDRRLIPYMTFYLAQPAVPQTRYVQREGSQNSDRGWPYPPSAGSAASQELTFSQRQQPQYVVAQYNPYETRFAHQSNPLSKLITQNYLAIAKQSKSNSRIIYQQPSVQEFPPTNPALIQEDENNAHREEAETYREQEPLRYQPIRVSLSSSVGGNKFKNSPLQYHQESLYQYQTPELPTIQRPKPQQIKQHLTEVTSQQTHPNFNAQQSDDGLRVYSQTSGRPNYQPVTANPIEPTVTIMQSHEIDVGTASPDYLSSPTATVPPKYSILQDAPITKYHAVYLAKPTAAPEVPSYKEQYAYYDEEETQLNNIFNGGESLSKSLPDRITPQNLDSSIKTLSKLLKILQKANALPNSAKQIVKTFPKYTAPSYPLKIRKIPTQRPPPRSDEDGTPGRAGIDYPVHGEIPETTFSCKTQRYKGFFGDPETGCQAWHYCDLNGGQASFLCPNGTIFSQVALTCDWWFNVKCQSTAQLYVLNERLYKYILPHKPSFPEDFAGPLVDQYLTRKFNELEQKKNETEDIKDSKGSTNQVINDADHQVSLDDVESENKVRSISNLG